MSAFRVGRVSGEFSTLAPPSSKRPAAESYRLSLGVEHRKHQPPAKSIVRAAFLFLHHQPALFQLLLGRAFLPQMRRKRFPTVGRKSEPKSLGCVSSVIPRCFRYSRATRASALDSELILPPVQRPLIQLE